MCNTGLVLNANIIYLNYSITNVVAVKIILNLYNLLITTGAVYASISLLPKSGYPVFILTVSFHVVLTRKQGVTYRAFELDGFFMRLLMTLEVEVRLKRLLTDVTNERHH